MKGLSGNMSWVCLTHLHTHIHTLQTDQNHLTFVERHSRNQEPGTNVEATGGQKSSKASEEHKLRRERNKKKNKDVLAVVVTRVFIPAVL